jgi:hypothetical protein
VAPVANQQDGHEADLLKDMKKNTYQINLGNKKDSFSLNDFIFALEESTKIFYLKDTTCISCDKDLEKKGKNFW